MKEEPDVHSSQSLERRIQPRCAVEDAASLLLLNHGLATSGHIVDLSLSGCRLRVSREFRLNSLGRVEITFKVKGIAFRLSGFMQWTDGDQTVGIRFGEMTTRRRDELSELLAEIEAEVSAKAERAEADRGAAEKLNGEIQATQRFVASRNPPEPVERSNQAAQNQIQLKLAQEKLVRERLAVTLLAEQREAQKRLAVQAAPARMQAQKPIFVRVETQRPTALGLAPPADKLPTVMGIENENRQDELAVPANAAARDRRVQARHSVDSQAAIYLVDVMSRVAGRIVDVSLSGCRIRTNDRFPVGIYRRVEVEFVLDGLPFRLGGVTQSLHDRRTVGVRFLDLSERKRDQLLMVVAEMDETHKENGMGSPESGHARN